jgi:small conductance mechanosensitive channel
MAGPILAAGSFLDGEGDAIAAAITLLVALALVVAVHRAMRGRARRLVEAFGGEELRPVIDTRLRFLRRVVEAVIVVVGVAIAVAQVTELDRLAGAVLASSAIAAAVIGFAARQVLANAIAGVVLAITQPLRIGDLVTFEDHTGTVEDVTLTYTWLRTGSDARMIIPNERLAAGVLRNDSIRSATVALEVALWLSPDADEAAAVETLEALDDARTVRVDDATEQGVRLVVAGPAVAPSERLAREAELRAKGLRALREAGIARLGTKA